MVTIGPSGGVCLRFGNKHGREIAKKTGSRHKICILEHTVRNVLKKHVNLWAKRRADCFGHYFDLPLAGRHARRINQYPQMIDLVRTQENTAPPRNLAGCVRKGR